MANLTNAELALNLRKANLKVLSLTERRKTAKTVLASKLESNIKMLLLEKLDKMDDVVHFQSYVSFNFGIKFI